MKSYWGKVPEADDGWKMVESVVSEGTRWMVFEQPQAHTDEWFNYKIVADGKVQRKANYWLARSKRTGQIGFTRDYALLREHRPEVHAKVESMFEGMSI
jgi:hypothetical protein